MQDKYIVSNDRKFYFCDNYYKVLNIHRPLSTVATLPLYEGDNLRSHASRRADITFMQYMTKSYEAGLVIDALRNVGKLRRFERCLDIGSGPAIQLRFMKMTGHVSFAEAMDIYEGRSRLPEFTFLSNGVVHSALNVAFKLQRSIPSRISQKIPYINKFREKYPFGIQEFSRTSEAACIFRPRFERTLDDYIVANIFDISNKYDLITSYMALDYFNFDEIVGKVAELLLPGGIFAFIVSYWWYPVNNTLLYGRFPYLLQQFNTDEVLSYYRKIHPDLDLSGIERRMGYSDPNRLTISDYESIGYKHGLIPLSAVRLHPNLEHDQRAIIGPLAIDRLKGWSLNEVIENAQRWKPNLSVADLMTSHVLLTFEKRIK